MPLKEIKKYFSNGQLMYHYYEDENGLAQGECKNYYENGQLSIHCYCKDNRWHGERTEYNEDGSIYAIKWYSHDKDVTDHYKKIFKWKEINATKRN